MDTHGEQTSLATFGGGCFWCVEALFQRVPGVVKIVSGYAGGQTQNPDYTSVCSGQTGHAEVVKLSFQSETISYRKLLEIFWKTHDPTTLNRQGNDIGTQYRSIVLCHSEEQLIIANELKQTLDLASIWDQPIVTEIKMFDIFFPAEEYHQNYFQQNSQQPYCRYVIAPKLEKFRYPGNLHTN